MKLGQLISLITLFVLLAPYFSFAQELLPNEPSRITPPGIPVRFFSCAPTDPLRICLLKLLEDALKVIIVIAIGLAAIFFAIAGIKYIITPDKKEDAKNRLVFGAVGLVVALLAWIGVVVITRIVQGGKV